MSDRKRYETYKINRSVLARAKWAFDEYMWQAGVVLPNAVKDALEGALERAVREAANAGRTNGWFERQDLPEGEKQSYKVHIFEGEEAGPARLSKYGFHLMQEGMSYMIECNDGDIPRLRAAATSYAKDHGMSFIVNKCAGGAKVTRSYPATATPLAS